MSLLGAGAIETLVAPTFEVEMTVNEKNIKIKSRFSRECLGFLLFLIQSACAFYTRLKNAGIRHRSCFL